MTFLPIAMALMALAQTTVDPALAPTPPSYPPIKEPAKPAAKPKPAAATDPAATVAKKKKIVVDATTEVSASDVVKKAAPAPAPRATPANPGKLTKERIAAYQIAMEQMNFSSGFIDGDAGMRTVRVVKAYQISHRLPVTGVLDEATRTAIGDPGEPYTDYVVTAQDMALVVPTPKLWREKSKVAFLGYNDPWEMLGEKFHCTIPFLKALNPGVEIIAEGTTVVGPRIAHEGKLPKGETIRVSLSECTIQVLDPQGQIIAHFPCSIAKDKAKRPSGQLLVEWGVPDPDYTFDPAVLKEAAQAEGITKKMTIPPGPNGPVGTTWIKLNLEGYGMHGTPEPEAISRTQSHGCFRLANWNAEKLLKMVKKGMIVNVEP